MKILFIAPRMHTNQYPILKGLVDSGIDVRFYCFFEGATEDHSVTKPLLLKKSLISRLLCWINKKRYNPSDAETKNLKVFMPGIFNVIKILKHEKPDLIIARERSKCNAIVSLVCKLLRFKNIIIYNQAPVHVEYKGWKNRIFSPVRYTPVKVINEKQEIVSKAPAHTYFMPFVYECADNVKHYPQHGDKIEILDVGKYRDYKNHFILVDAAFLLIKKGILSFNITIVGQVTNQSEKEYYDSLLKYVSEKNLDNYVSLKHSIPYSEMNSLYSKSDILVLPSKKEVAGMVVIESMANGLCTISTDNNGTACYVLESGGGDLFNHKSAEDLAEKLQKYIINPIMLQDAGRMGKAYVRDNCSVSKYISNLDEICKKEFDFSLEINA